MLVERTTRLVVLAKMANASAESALHAFTAKLNSIAAPLRQTLTYDQGHELARHRELTAATGVTVYFCDIHRAWHRSSCENTNGLPHQFLLKGTDLSVHDHDMLDSIADLMNNRSRQTINWRFRIEAFADLLRVIEDKAHGATVHLSTPRCCTSDLNPTEFRPFGNRRRCMQAPSAGKSYGRGPL